MEGSRVSGSMVGLWLEVSIGGWAIKEVNCWGGEGDEGLGRSAGDTMDDNGFHLVYHFQTIPLSFTFQFYGHEINQITIATGGRLFPVAQGNFDQQLQLLLLMLLTMTVSIDDGILRKRRI